MPEKCMCGLELSVCTLPKCGKSNKRPTNHTCACGKEDSNCSYPDCQNGAYHGGIFKRVRQEEHLIKPVVV